MDDPPLKTLVVDDEPLATERLQLLLARIGGVDLVGTASDGEAACRMAEALAPDLLLLDIAMPGMDGIELVRELRGKAITKAKPILVLTTEHESDIKARGREAGATGWIVKPFDAQALLKVLPRVLA